MKLEFTGEVKNGKLHIVNRKNFDKAVEQFDGKRVEIVVSLLRSKRSSPQNRYYWGAVIPIMANAFKDLGHRLSKDETHEFLKNKFLKGEEIINEDVFIGNKPTTTTNLTKSEFADYVSEITQFAAEYLNVIIPEPLEQAHIEIA